MAAYGLLARTYLSMGDYQNVFLYADSALKIYSTLLDYNKVTGTMSTSANLYNAETVLITQDQGGTGGASSNWFISNDLVNSYSSNDLRKSKFFLLQTTGGITGYRWVGDYTGGQAFTGIANDELYLMRAEASARLGNTAAAMADLNVLLVTRYVTGTYVNRTATDAGNALVQILAERRKELVHRAGLRWTDLRRLNTDSRFAVTLTRTVAGVTYTLPPNDARYTLRIPDYITANAPDIIQNP